MKSNLDILISDSNKSILKENDFNIDDYGNIIIKSIPKNNIIVIDGDNIEIINKNSKIIIKEDLTIEAKDINIVCENLTADISGNIDLGENGGSVITTLTHPMCYATGAKILGSQTVRCKS